MARQLAGLLIVLLIGSAVEAKAESGATARPAHVYLFRGFAPLSWGMDTLGSQLEQRHIRTSTYGHTAWSKVADEIVAAARGSQTPVILAGHSFGADATISVAERLNAAHIPVRLIVTLDATTPRSVPGNVNRLVNYYLSNSLFNARMSGARSINKDLATKKDVGHFNVALDAKIRAAVVGEIIAAAENH